jgi:hypothetical protein
MKSPILEQVKNAIRNPYAWPGGYPVYVIMSDGEMLCPKCARAEYKQIVRDTKTTDRGCWTAAGADVYWEGADQHCAHCNEPLPSAYGDPSEA